MAPVKNTFIPKLKSSHQNTESATSTSAWDRKQKGMCKDWKEVTFVWGFSLCIPNSLWPPALRLVQEGNPPQTPPHLECLFQRQMRWHQYQSPPPPAARWQLAGTQKHFPRSAGKQRSRLRVHRGKKRAVQYLGLILVWFYYFVKSLITDITKKLSASPCFTFFSHTLGRYCRGCEKRGVQPPLPGLMQRETQSSQVNE